MTTRVVSRVAFISVRGELDLATGGVLADNMLCHDGKHDAVVFELDGLRFMDVAGFRALLECTNGNEAVSIRNPSLQVRRLLQLVNMENLIEEDAEGQRLISR